MQLEGHKPQNPSLFFLFFLPNVNSSSEIEEWNLFNNYNIMKF